MRLPNFGLLLVPIAASMLVACSGSSESGTSASELASGEPPSAPPTALPGTPPPSAASAPAAPAPACYAGDAEWPANVVVDWPAPERVCTSSEIDRIAAAVAVASDGDLEIADPPDVSDACAACIGNVALQHDPPDPTATIAAYACVAALTSGECAQDASDQRDCFLVHCSTCAANAYESCVDQTIDAGKCARLPPACKTAIETSGALECLHGAEVPGDDLAATRKQLAFVARTLCGG